MGVSRRMSKRRNEQFSSLNHAVYRGACLPLLILLYATKGAAQEPARHLRGKQAEVVEGAVKRGVEWLATRQDTSGAFRSESNLGICPVALSAMALWALSRQSTETWIAERAGATVDYLMEHRQSDGGIYNSKGGLAVYTSGVAGRALRSLAERADTEVPEDVLRAVDLFVYRRGVPESIVDSQKQTGLSKVGSQKRANELLDRGGALAPSTHKALRFLSRCREQEGTRAPVRARVPGWRSTSGPAASFSYEDVLPIVYLPLKPQYPITLRAQAAIRTYYTLERNPDLTRRYGNSGFQRGTQGLYYYYLVLARALSTFQQPRLELADGRRVDWVRELSDRLIATQRADGSWANSDGSWWESEPVLVTSYALLSLSLCRDVRAIRRQ